MEGFHQGQWLKFVVTSHGSALHAAEKMNVEYTTLTRWFRKPVIRMQSHYRTRLLRFLGLSPLEFDQLLVRAQAEYSRVPPQIRLAWTGAIQNQKDSSDSAIDLNVDPYSERQLPGEIPTFELSVAAGTWVDVSDTGAVCDPRQIDHGLFRVRIRGDSMKPAYADGALIEFRCLREGRDPLTIGKDYYVQRDGEATFKRLESFDEERMIFRAVNRRKYPRPFVVPRGDVRRMAIALAKVTLV